MLLRLASVATLLSVSTLAGCGGVWVEGSGGSGPPEPHKTLVTAYADATPTWCAEWRKPIPGITVFSSNPDGSLLDQATTDAAGQATLRTIEGGYASAAWPSSNIMPELHTYAVQPGIDSLEFAFGSDHTCNPVPMHVHVDATPVPAQNPFVRVCDAWAPIDPNTWTAEVDFTPCSYDGTFTVALTDDSQSLLAVSPRAPYLGGGTANVSIGPLPPVAEIGEVSANTSASDLHGSYSGVDAGGTPLSWSSAFSAAQVGSDASVTWSVRAAPGVRIQMSYADSACQGASWYTDLDTSAVAGQTTTLDPGRLARPARQGDGTWRLDGGDLGDAVVALRVWGDSKEIWWTQWLPAGRIVVLPNLVLPASIAELIPAGPEQQVMVENYDVREAASFAELAALTEPSKFGPTYVSESNTGCWPN